MYEPRSSAEITRDLIARTVARTSLTDLAESSTLGVLLRSIAEQIAEADVRLAQIRSQFTLKGARGVDLDERAEEIGVTRLTATAASGTVVVTRTDSSASLTIPAGSVFGRGDSDVTYSTTALSIVANTRGTLGNAPPRSIDTILDAPSALVSVTQGEALANATDAETDLALRSRATLALNSIARAQPIALEYTARTFTATDGTRATTATVYEPETRLGYVELLIDDGSGLGDHAPTRSGEAVSLTLNAVLGQLIGVEAPVVGSVRVRSGSSVLIEGRDYDISRSRGVITLRDAANVSIGDTITVDNYSVYTGLIAELQALMNGDPNDVTSGHRAAGIALRVLPAPVQRIPLDVLIVIDAGSTLTTVKANVESAISAYFSALGAGAPAYRSALVSVVMGVGGVVNATILTSGTANETPDLYPNSARHVLRAGNVRAITSTTGG
jgi:uncharacterized phage protein gp47/JayE